MRTGFESILLGIELGTSEVKGEGPEHYTTEDPKLSQFVDSSSACALRLFLDFKLDIVRFHMYVCAVEVKNLLILTWRYF